MIGIRRSVAPVGSLTASVTVVDGVSTLARPGPSIALTTRRWSLSRSSRCLVDGNPKPYASHSSLFQPAPRPRIARPPEMTSRVLIIFETRAGLRQPVDRTACPSRTRLVEAAIADREVKDSKVISSRTSGAVWRWSTTHTDSNPSRSA